MLQGDKHGYVLRAPWTHSSLFAWLFFFFFVLVVQSPAQNYTSRGIRP